MNRLANLHSSSPPNSQLDSNESKRLELILAMKRQNFEAAVSIARSVLSTDQPAFDLELTATLSSLYSKISIDATIKKLYGLYFASLNKCRLAQLAENLPEFQIWSRRRNQIVLLTVTCLLESGKAFTASTLLDSAAQSLVVGQDVEMLSAAGRLFLQLGNVFAAKSTFSRVEELINQLPEVPPPFYDLLMLNRGHLAIATGDWLSASTILTSLISVNPGNKIAINNLAVCMIYLGKLQEASALMESLKSNEIEEGFEEINLNLNTLKELSG